MILYHGTTRRVGRKIARDGFHPKAPTGRVWFAKSSGYAKQRAHNKARRVNDRPVVLTVDVDLHKMRRQYGAKQVRESGGVVSINGIVPATMLREHRGLGVPESRGDVVRWLNGILRVKSHKGVNINHPGVGRLLNWINDRLAKHPHAQIGNKELLSYATQWIPEHFSGVVVDFEHMRVLPWSGGGDDRHGEGEYVPEPPPDHRAEDAVECLESDKPQRQIRGLKLLADLGDADLFDWCVLLLGQDDPELKVGVLKVLRRCEDIEPEMLSLHADSDNKAVRAAAIEVLGLRGGERSHEWFWKGLIDPEPHVRLSAVKFLDRLDPQIHRDIFETALYDPHPQVAQAAQKLVKGQGFAKLVW